MRVWLLLIRGAVREGLYALALLTLTGAVASAQPVCPGTATLTVFVENLSGTPTIAVELDGELAADTATCGGSGATSYRETVTCTGSGVVRCGQLAALQPGTWVHRLSVTVPGSATQQQAQRVVLVAGSPAEVPNALVWTVYPQTFVVQAASAAELQARLDDATAYARENPGPALVIFSADAFPGAIAPQRIYLLQPPCSLDVTHNRCSPDGTWDGWTAGVCSSATGSSSTPSIVVHSRVASSSRSTPAGGRSSGSMGRRMSCGGSSSKAAASRTPHRPARSTRSP